MSQLISSEPRPDSLVLYKGQAAVVRSADAKKLAIETAAGEKVSVRPKDVTLLHPGPLRDLRQLVPPPGDPLTAWELLDGQTTTLPELAALTYGEVTPASVWAAWTLVADGLYFSGTPERVAVHPAALTRRIDVERKAKAAEAAAWEAFIARARRGSFAPEDERYLAEVIELAFDRTDNNRALRVLGRSQTPQVAHAFLLEIGYWDTSTNPYPARFGLTTLQPEVELPPLPDEERIDLTHLVALAIDDAGSSDPDDALSLDGSRLWVHVADAAVVVAPDSPADLEARHRGANLYLPEGTVRMLPPEATDRLALGLAERSPALSFALDLDSDGQVTAFDIRPSWVRGTRLTYDEAETKLDEPLLRELIALAERRRAGREANGAVEIELPEVKVKVDGDGQVVVTPLPPLRSRTLVREAMLMAGEALGRFAVERDIPLLFTAQDPRAESDIPYGGPAGWFAVRRTMQRGRQQTSPGPHAGLGLDIYVQATSPLRRYLDLVVHQQVRAYLAGRPLLDAQALLMRAGAADNASGAVRRAERFSLDHWRMVYLLQHPHWQGEGVVVDQREKVDTVLIPDLALEFTLPSRNRSPNDVLALALTGVDLPTLSARFRER